MKILKYLGVLALGVLAGVAGTLLHSTPVKAPWIGLILAILLVMAGAWIAWELQKKVFSLLYALGVEGAVIGLFTFPPANDMLAAPREILFYLWIGGSLLAVLLTPFLARWLVEKYSAEKPAAEEKKPRPPRRWRRKDNAAKTKDSAAKTKDSAAKTTNSKRK
ncbi:hypothetical protein [uncultured Arcanobacterium sp.]|uniref:hypothetical protein n=1 Tax=uncultured Arcanobacterium sp. TaxID=487520 RepID=UPI002618DE84|nr:hypothetical protein [uncultured Arcanobacterium sp.]